MSVEFIQIISSLGVCFTCLFAFSDIKKTKTKRFSVVNCLERSQSQCISVDPVSVMYVCLTTLGKKKICHWMGFQKYKKCRLSYFYNWLYLCILYQWNFFILEIKGYNKKKILEKKICLAWWCGPTPTGPRVWFLAGVAGSWLLISDFSRRSLALFLSLLLFPHLSVFFYFSLFLLPYFLSLP